MSDFKFQISRHPASGIFSWAYSQRVWGRPSDDNKATTYKPKAKARLPGYKPN